jgi:hypothetical protein
MVCQLGSQRDVEEPHRYPHRVPHRDRENHSGHRYRRNPELQCQRNDVRHTEGDEHKRVGVFPPNALKLGLSDEFTPRAAQHQLCHPHRVACDRLRGSLGRARQTGGDILPSIKA